jgi:hypothetical protein
MREAISIFWTGPYICGSIQYHCCDSAGELALGSNVPDVGLEIFRAYCNILDGPIQGFNFDKL